MHVEPVALPKVHRAETARIVVGDARAVIEVENHMVVRREAGDVVIEGARIVQTIRCIDLEASGHAEMRDPGQSLVEADGEELCAPPDPEDAPPRQTLREPFRKRPAQVRAARLDA